MRIAFVSTEHGHGRRGGGIGTYVDIMAPALARRGHDIWVVTQGPSARLEDEGVSILRLDHPSLPDPTTQRVLAAWRVARATARLEPDLVQAAEWEADAWWLARLGRVPLVTRLATPTYVIDWLHGGRSGADSEVVRRMERDQAVRSAALLAPSCAIAELVARGWGFPAESVEVIPNPVAGPLLRAAEAAEPPVRLPPRFLVYFGRMEYRKGIGVLIDALPEVLGAQPDLHMVFVGADRAGVLRDALEGPHVAAVADRIHALGHLARPQAMSIVARAEAAVLPSLWEAFGFVAAEALALGRPVITTHGSGLAEVVEDGVSGWLVPPGDAAALARVLTQRLSDPEALRTAGEAARERAERFDADLLAQRLEAMYERVLESRRDGRFAAGIYARGYRRAFRPEDPRGPFHDLYAAKLAEVVALFPHEPRLRILDAGGGPGRLSAPLARHHEVTMLDISPEMLEEARTACPPGVRLVQGDARELPFGDEEFQATAALDLLTHLPVLEDGIRELARVTRPGGRLVFDTSNASPWWVLAYPSYVDFRPRRLMRTMRAGGVLPEWTRLVRHHRAEEVEEAIDALGLHLERRLDFGPAWSAKWQLWVTRTPA